MLSTLFKANLLKANQQTPVTKIFRDDSKEEDTCTRRDQLS